MDIPCTRCGEPWSVHHLQHGAVYDAVKPPITEVKSLPDGSTMNLHLWAAKNQVDLPTLSEAECRDRAAAGNPLAPHVRASMKLAGWEFGSSVLVVRRCPGCEGHEGHEATGADNRFRDAQMLADLLGDDADGLAAELSELSTY